MTTLIDDPVFQKAVSNIPLRSEKEQNKDKLIQSYVDTGIFVRLDNHNSQIFYGRRGTGKTHVLQVLAQKINERKALYCVYVDLRSLGSNTQNDPDRLPTHNAILLFKDLLAEIQNALIHRALSDVCDVSPEGFEALDSLANVTAKAASIRIDTGGIDREKFSAESEKGLNIEAKLSSSPSLTGTANAKGKAVKETDRTINYNLIEKHHVIFNEIRQLLEIAVQGQQLDYLYILIDEWSGAPTACQPYLAEYIKRALLTSSRIVVKIASLEYRSDFSFTTAKNNVVGFELGADISAGLDLDDYWIFDRNPEGVTETFRKVLYRHIVTELPDDHLCNQYDILHQGSLITAIFSGTKAFVELVRSAEGVARDFINIFARAFFDASRRGRSKVDMQAVTESARQWYEQDKQPQLDEAQNRLLSKIVSNVIGEKKARSFMVERNEANHPLIGSLFDYRILHLIQRGYADKSNPGIRYNIYTLDYGTYVDLLKTKQLPEVELIEIDDIEQEPERIVPFDDKRSIRRIILSADQLRIWAGDGGGWEQKQGRS